MFCLDTSDWMRNGDYAPSRLEAQRRTVDEMAKQFLDGNQESTVGLLTMGGKRYVQS